jgi:ferredoxin--NADP+ reductase
VSEVGDSQVELDIDVQQLRQQHYNATITQRIDTHSDLARFRIRPDFPMPTYDPGQYVALGLGLWEPRLPGTQSEEVSPKRRTKLGKRAYSISCPLVDAAGQLAPCNTIDYFEFYITLVRQASSADGKPPLFTPRLFLLNQGDRISVEHRVVGTYTLGNIDPEHTVLFLGTGTGEAPHNAMLAELLRRGHPGRILVVTSARNQRDLAYAAEHAILASRYNNYTYVPLTTREPHNIDSKHPNYVGKQYLQQYFSEGHLKRIAGIDLSPANTHVFLCGNPAMIGFVPKGAPPLEQPGMLQLLLAAGFHEHHEHLKQPPGAGSIRFEKYW